MIQGITLVWIWIQHRTLDQRNQTSSIPNANKVQYTTPVPGTLCRPTNLVVINHNGPPVEHSAHVSDFDTLLADSLAPCKPPPTWPFTSHHVNLNTNHLGLSPETKKTINKNTES